MSIVYREIDEKSLLFFDEEDLTEKSRGLNGFASTCVNLLKSIIGTGLLALPYTFNTLGPLLSIPLLIIFAYFSVVGLHIYSLCGMRAGVDCIGLVCRMVDWKLQVMVDAALLIMSIGTAVSYFSIIGDSIPGLMHFKTTWNLNREMTLLLSTIILMPLVFLKTTKHLRYTSILGLAGIAFTFYLSLQLMFTNGISSNNHGPLFNISSEGFKQLNVIVFVFTCHQNLLYIKADAKDKSESFIGSVINTCIMVSGLIYLIFSMASWLAYGTSINSNILNNYPNGMMTDLAKWLYVGMAAFSFPLLIPAGRTAISNLVPFHINPSTSTIIIVLCSLLISIFVKDLSIISTWIGMLAGVPICFLLPGYLHYKYFNEDPSSDKNFKINSFTSIIMCVVGLMLLLSFLLI